MLLAQYSIVKSTTSESATPQWISKLQLVTEARLPTNAFWLLASPTQIDTVELAYLEADGGPVVEERAGFETDNHEWKIRHVFGARFFDWRGAVRIPTT